MRHYKYIITQLGKLKKDNPAYKMVGSDFLQSFVGKMAGKKEGFFNNLLNNQKLSASLSGHF